MALPLSQSGVDEPARAWLTGLTLQVNSDRQQQEQNQERNEASTQQLEQQQRQQASSPSQVGDAISRRISPSSYISYILASSTFFWAAAPCRPCRHGLW